MAEFDSAGFAAVDKFFGGVSDGDADAPRNKPSSLSAKGKKRGGVGATISKKQVDATKLAENVLKVGRKRSRDGAYDDSDHEFHDVDDNDDLDVGRTAIAKDSKKKVKSGVDAQLGSQKKSKKKLGKKERQRQLNHEAAEQAEPKPINNAASHNSVTTDAAPADGGTAKKQQQPRKRKKVRSKQKNIRKDRRSMAEKPAHLIPGNPNYQGRPLTQATRERLRNPAPVGKRVVGDHETGCATKVAKQERANSKDSTFTATKVSHNDNDTPRDSAEESLFVIDREGDDVGVVIDTKPTKKAKKNAAGESETSSKKKKKKRATKE